MHRRGAFQFPQDGIAAAISRAASSASAVAEEAGAFRQLEEPVAVVVHEPRIESALADTFDDVENADSYDFVDGQDGLGMARRGGDDVIYLAEEFGAKIGAVHGVRFLLWGVCSTQDAGCVGIFNLHSN